MLEARQSKKLRLTGSLQLGALRFYESRPQLALWIWGLEIKKKNPTLKALELLRPGLISGALPGWLDIIEGT